MIISDIDFLVFEKTSFSEFKNLTLFIFRKLFLNLYIIYSEKVIIILYLIKLLFYNLVNNSD